MPDIDREELAREAVRTWVGPAAVLLPLDAMNSSTWEVRSDGVRTVLKIAASGSLPGLEAASWLRGHGIRSGAPLHTTIRDGLVIALLEYVEGRPLDRTDATTIGKSLGSVHRHLADAPVPDGMDRWPWSFLAPSAIVDPALRVAAEAAIERAHAVASALRHGILHGDPAPEAFVERDGDVGVIDWGSAVHGPLLFDVASARMYAGPLVLDGYAATGPLGAEELALVPVFLAFRWALQAWYFSDRLARDDLTGIDDRTDNECGIADARAYLLGE